MKKEYELLEKAIKNKQVVDITFKQGLGEDLTVPFHPYIIGSDLMQCDFVWGFLPNNRLQYKFDFNKISKVKLQKNTFNVLEGMIYHNADDEEHYCVVDGFTKTYITNRIF
jgi:hypothetical protein